MYCLLSFARWALRSAWLFALLVPAVLLAGSESGVSAVLDHFSDARRTIGGAERILVDDQAVGGKSRATTTSRDGVLRVEGELVPGRGMPAWMSLVLLTADGSPVDLTDYTGIRLRVKIDGGALSVQACSAEIQNFDYHTSASIVRKRGEFHEVRIPFADLKRAYSEPIPLNLQTITSVNLVAAGMAKGGFAYEVDEVGFY